MVRYTFRVAGQPVSGSLPLSLELQAVNIFENDHLSEFYLCEVNPKGQVMGHARRKYV